MVWSISLILFSALSLFSFSAFAYLYQSLLTLSNCSFSYCCACSMFRRRATSLYFWSRVSLSFLFSFYFSATFPFAALQLSLSNFSCSDIRKLLPIASICCREGAACWISLGGAALASYGGCGEVTVGSFLGTLIGFLPLDLILLMLPAFERMSRALLLSKLATDLGLPSMPRFLATFEGGFGCKKRIMRSEREYFGTKEYQDCYRK